MAGLMLPQVEKDVPQMNCTLTLMQDLHVLGASVLVRVAA